MRYTLVLAVFFAILQTTTSCANACGNFNSYHPCQPGESPYSTLLSTPHAVQDVASGTRASLEHLRAAVSL